MDRQTPRITTAESQNSSEQLKTVIFMSETSKGVRREHVTSLLQCRPCKYALYCHLKTTYICAACVLLGFNIKNSEGFPLDFH